MLVLLTFWCIRNRGTGLQHRNIYASTSNSIVDPGSNRDSGWQGKSDKFFFKLHCTSLNQTLFITESNTAYYENSFNILVPVNRANTH